MTDPRDLAARYLRQLMELGENPIVLSDPPARTSTGAGAGPRTDRDGKAAPPPQKGRAPVKESPGEGPDRMKDAPPIPGRGIVIENQGRDLFKEDPLADLDLDQIASQIKSCTKCDLCSSRTHAVPGEGPARSNLVVVGEGPGATEDETGRPFVGKAGELLTKILAAIDLPREQVFICNVVKCRPPSNRKPVADEIEACVPYLYRQIDILKPKVILAMGATAAETLLQTRQSLGSLRDRVHYFRGTPLIVTYHPAALLRNPNWKKPTWDDVRIARRLLDG